MVSYDPFTPPLPATVPQSSPSPTTSPLVTPSAHATEATHGLVVKNVTHTGFETENHTLKERSRVDWHEFDGAECCDLGSSVSGIDGETFHIIPLLPMEETASSPTSAPAIHTRPLNLVTPAQNNFLDFTSEPAVIKHPANKACGTCHRCGLHKGSSVHHKLHPMQATSEFTATPIAHRHGLPAHTLSAFVPDIEAANVCPDIESPTSPVHDRKSDPFEVYIDHERIHRRRGSSNLRTNSFSAATEEPDEKEVAPQAVMMPVRRSSLEDNGEGTGRQRLDLRFRKERVRKAREQLYFGNERVDEGVKFEIMQRGLNKPLGVVEIGVVERAEL